MLEALALLFMFLFPAFGMAWTDSVSKDVVGELTVVASDTANNWNDGIGNRADGMLGVSDTSPGFSDATIQRTGCLRSASDDLNNYGDSVVSAIILGAIVSDANSLSDFTPILSLVFEADITDDANLFSDASLLRSAGQLSASDTVSLSDGAGVGLGLPLVVSDTLPTIAEFVVTFPRAPIAVEADDSLANWIDFTPGVGIDYEILVDDGLGTFSDSVNQSIGYRLAVSDSAANWNDEVSTSLAGVSSLLTLAAGDNANNLTDGPPQLSLVYDLAATESVNNWNDAANTLSAGQIVVGDALPAWADSESHGAVIGLAVSDAVPGLSDAVLQRGDGSLDLTDALLLTDAVRMVGTAPVVVDDDANYLDDDSEQQVFSGSERTINAADTFAQTDDLTIEATGVLVVSDSTSQTDAVTLQTNVLLLVLVANDALPGMADSIDGIFVPGGEGWSADNQGSWSSSTTTDWVATENDNTWR